MFFELLLVASPLIHIFGKQNKPDMANTLVLFFITKEQKIESTKEPWQTKKYI